MWILKVTFQNKNKHLNYTQCIKRSQMCGNGRNVRILKFKFQNKDIHLNCTYFILRSKMCGKGSNVRILKVKAKII